MCVKCVITGVCVCVSQCVYIFSGSSVESELLHGTHVHSLHHRHHTGLSVSHTAGDIMVAANTEALLWRATFMRYKKELTSVATVSL